MPGRIALLGFEPPVPAPALYLEMPANPQAYAEKLYVCLRQADAAGVDLIGVVLPTQNGDLWNALRDRILRPTSDW